MHDWPQTHLYIRVLGVHVSFGQVWEILEIEDEGLSLLFGLRLREHTD